LFLFFSKDFSNVEKVYINSHAEIMVRDGIYDNKNDNEMSVSTVAYSNIVVEVEKKLPLWVYIVSVFIGLILLLLSIFAFWAVSYLI
jgi:hypothetical protein